MVDDRYELVRPVRRAVTDTVWTALDARLGRQVAVRVFAPGRVTTAVAAEFLPRLCLQAHPVLERVIDAGHDDATDSVYLVTHLPEGRPLSELPSPEPGLLAHVDDRVRWALAELHTRGLSHGRLSAADIFLADVPVVGQDYSQVRVTVTGAGAAQLGGALATPAMDLDALDDVLRVPQPALAATAA